METLKPFFKIIIKKSAKTDGLNINHPNLAALIGHHNQQYPNIHPSQEQTTMLKLYRTKMKLKVSTWLVL